MTAILDNAFATESVLALPAEDEPEIVRYMNISQAGDLWLGAQELAPTTVRTYRAIINELHDFCGDVDVSAINLTTIRRFLDAYRVNKRDPRKHKADDTRATAWTVVHRFYDWLTVERLIKDNPTRRNGMRVIPRPRRKRPEDNDNIVSVSTAEVRRLLEACEDWDEKLCMYTLALLGPRRTALTLAKITDYVPDADPPTLTFREKGSKTIAKTVPHRLQELFAQAQAAGVYETQDWLVPNRLPGFAREKWRPSVGENTRDDAVIYDIVKRVGDRAGIRVHVHALRAAFATFSLESGKSKYALQLALGHKRGDTTDIYLRRYDKQQQLETFVDLDYGV